ncbi:MAG: MBL fold metallo-hydrolase, partial [Spirochaetia bacterium]|nr:MBL fold metallo-hydrolase [Spirochaetia bacterium]
MSITIFSQGAAGEVTGSRHFLFTDKAKVLVDCGAFQGKREEADRKNRQWDFDASALDAVVLTHAHYDHCGLIPLLPKHKYQGNIYSTAATRDVANLIMMDSCKIQAADAVHLAKRAAKLGKTFDWEPLYKDTDVVEAISQFVTLSYNRPQIIADGITAKFFDAGHILGSSLIHLTIKDGDRNVRVLYSGDLGRNDEPILKDPQPADPAEYIILESTYGDRLHEGKKDVMPELAKIVNETVARGGKIIIPAFAVGRTQELVFYLHLLHDQNLIP